MLKTCDRGMIWVWTAKTEDIAKERGYEPRPAGKPANCGDRLLGRYAPKVWVDKGYVEAVAE